MNLPVSVIMAVYNEPLEYIRESIESVLNQTFRDYELLIVVDNPNNTDLVDFITTYVQKDTRVRILVNDKNIGLAESLNRAIKESNGIYLARMDADDISFPERLRIQVDYLNKHEEISMVCSTRIDIDSQGKIINQYCFVPRSDTKLLSSLSYGSIITHPSVMMKKADVEEVGLYNNYPCGQDYDLWIRFKAAGKKIHFMLNPLLYYRIHGSNETTEKKVKQWLCANFARKNLAERKEFSRACLDLYIDQNLKTHDLINRFDSLQKAKSAPGYAKIPLIAKSLKSNECRKKLVYSLLNRFNIKEIFISG